MGPRKIRSTDFIVFVLNPVDILPRSAILPALPGVGRWEFVTMFASIESIEVLRSSGSIQIDLK